MTSAELLLELGGGVENDHEEEAQRLPDACDGMGGLLRFRLHG